MCRLTILIVCLSVGLLNIGYSQEGIVNLRNMGYVVVSPEGPEDGGDFGPRTKGSKTSGVQEAFNYAKSNRKNVYIVGGGMPATFKEGVVYHIYDTLKIPWMQDFRLDGGEYVLAYDKSTGPAIVIDSQMNCVYKFGVIVSLSNGTVIHFKPETKGPDNFSVITGSIFEFNAVVGGGSVWIGKGEKPKGIGILLDASSGSINRNRIFAHEIVACDKGVYLKEDDIAHNWIEVLFNHLCNTHLQIGGPGTSGPGPAFNRFDMHIDGQGIEGNTGVEIFGKRNVLTLDIHGTTAGKDIIFGESAKDNLITAINLSSGITNKSTVPTNRIVSLTPIGFGISTPSIPESGKDVMNTNPYLVEVIILTPGRVSNWTITDANGKGQTVSAGLSAGERFILEPGDKIRFTYTVVPTWKWRALR